MTTRRRLAATMLAAMMITSLVLPLAPSAGATASAATTTTARAAGDGDTKTACAYTQHSISALDRFSAMVGRTVDCAVVFSDTTTTWPDWEQPWVLGGNNVDTQWAAWYRAVPGRTLVVTQSLVPVGITGDWRALGASGAYDDYIRTWATGMVAAGLGSTIIRLGHEANGDWYFDSIGSTPTDYANWAAYWARFVRVARSVPGAAFSFDWTVNPGYRRIPFDSYYPGDDVVDIIGVDQYDGVAYAPNPLPTTDAARWTAILAQQWGLGDLMTYATAHGKPLSIPEWGLMVPGSSGGTGGGDDGYFVDRIAEIVRTHDVRYTSVWEMNDPTSSVALENNPAALAAYKAHFGGGGDSLPSSAVSTGTTTGTTPGAAAPPPVTPPAAGAAPSPAPPAVTPAARLATNVKAKVSAKAVSHGRRIRLAATVTSAGHPLGKATLLLERRVHGRWSLVSRLTSSRTGTVAWTHIATATTTYRVRFAGSTARAASCSASLTVTVHR